MPNPQEAVALIDKELDLPDSVQGVRKMVLRLDRRAIETARKVTDELLVARRLYDKQEPDSVAASDPVSLVFLAADDTLSGSEAAYKAAMWYQGQIAEAKREAMVVAMTMHTDVGDRQPKPYDAAANREDTDLPEWMQDEVRIPAPERSLRNRYERRLKVIYDLLDEAGALFSARFQEILDNDLAVQLRKLMESGNTDSDGFRPARASRKVPKDTVPADGG